MADTLTKRQLNNKIDSLVNLKGSIPKSITKTIIQPQKIVKVIDTIYVKNDSIYLEDFYPNKQNPFLKYSAVFNTDNKENSSNFEFQPVTLTHVVSKKEDGLYQIDFKGPEFIDVNSLSVQTEPIEKTKKDNWGTLIGIEYGKKVESKQDIIRVDAYRRYKKVYFGGGITTSKEITGGIKIEL